MFQSNPCTNGLASPPLMGIVYISPNISKTRVFPSLLTLRFDQVVSVVSIEMVFISPLGSVTSHSFSATPSKVSAENTGAKVKLHKREIMKVRNLLLIMSSKPR